jgi:hypothetical protein
MAYRWPLVVIVVGVVLLGALQLTPPLVADAWVRAGLHNAAGYLKITNLALMPRCVVGVEVVEPQGVRAAIHETILDPETGMHRMQRVGELCVAPFQSFELKPGGHHLMLMSSLEGVKEVRIRLHLKGGGTLEFTAPVRPLGG